MNYLISVIDDGAGLATPTEDAAIDAFNDRLLISTWRSNVPPRGRRAVIGRPKCGRS